MPAFCEHVNDVMVRTLNIEGSSRELARVILKDVGLTSQLLRVANSALYNRSGRRIMSVAHAITLLGWENVRAMLSAIRFVEHFAKASPSLRELMLLSVLNAVHSRDIAAVAGYGHPEEAYICGLLRNLGEVLVACYYPSEYDRIILAMHVEKIPVRAACLRHLDFDWDDLGRLVVDAWSIPSQVGLCMRGADAAGSAADQSLASITSYAHELTHTMYRRGDHVDTVPLRYITNLDGGKTLVSIRDLHRIAQSAAEETRQIFSQIGIPKNRLLLSHQAERAQQMTECIPSFTAASLEPLERAIDAARHKIKDKTFELTALITSLLEAIIAAGFDCAVFGLLNEAHTAVRGRVASGANSSNILQRFHFPVDRAEGPIRAALVRNTDVLVDRARDDRYDQSTVVAALQPAVFALLPLVTDGRAVACLYAGRSSASTGLNTVRQVLGRARDTIALAIRTKTARRISR